MMRRNISPITVRNQFIGEENIKKLRKRRRRRRIERKKERDTGKGDKNHLLA